ncbi:sodium channel protein Nach-like [Bicyclus anynana]|uniref:Sodium channel protein Nach-like n=1 Tax=Bicyclus anynana TaxID=110368 RepID=A0ABM3LNU1_BICAN|nr:sodium channel protein Nach-like [Bicyclus anynana]
MYPQKEFLAMLIRQDQRRYNRRHFKKPRKRPLPYVKQKMKTFLAMFFETSSIHGLSHLVAAGRHPCEIFLWLTMVIISVCGTLYLSSATWERYQSSPTVVSMERDMLAWNTTFPCVTLCPEVKIDYMKLERYVEKSNVEDKEALRNFIKALANATYDNFDTVPHYDGIKSDDYLDLLLDLSALFKPTLTTSTSGFDLQIMPTITEMGLCYSINSKVAVYNSPEYRRANRWDTVVNKNPVFFVHPLDGEVFAQVNITSSYSGTLHGPMEVPDITSKLHHSPEKMYMTLYVKTISVYTSPEAASLSVAQRRCRFQHENNLKHNSIYTYNMCRIDCRIRLCLQYCQCIPHFYRRIDNEQICDVSGLHCLHKHRDLISDLIDESGKKVENCSCFPVCDDVNYITDTYELQSWVIATTTLQWGMVTFPRTRYKRDIIFGYSDVLVAVGGMAGLFLGCSVISFIEISYFFTLRLFFYARDNLGKSTPSIVKH